MILQEGCSSMPRIKVFELISHNTSTIGLTCPAGSDCQQVDSQHLVIALSQFLPLFGREEAGVGCTHSQLPANNKAY